MTTMIGIWTAWLACAAAPGTVPLDAPRAPDPEPLIITQSTIEDFDPDFVEPPREAQRRSVPPRDPGELPYEQARRKFDAEIRRLEAMIAISKAAAGQ